MILTANNAQIGVDYQVNKVTIEGPTAFHLQRLGVVRGNRVTIIQRDKKSAIISIQQTRIALEKDILDQIELTEMTEANELCSLDLLKTGEKGKVVSIYGQGAIRRRLMDMGVTKNVEILIRKLAPLGDPIEVTLRGYELTLRKNEAALILVERIED